MESFPAIGFVFFQPARRVSHNVSSLIADGHQAHGGNGLSWINKENRNTDHLMVIIAGPLSAPDPLCRCLTLLLSHLCAVLC